MPPKPLNRDNTALAEQFFSQVSESIQLVFDLTSRIDERVKMLVEHQNDLDERVDKLLETHQSSLSHLAVIESKEYNSIIANLEVRVKNLELKVEMISMRIGNHDSRWLLIFDSVWKICLMLVGGYILYKLGISPPP